MASLGRFELPTPRLGGECSIQLSYRDKISGFIIAITVRQSRQKLKSVIKMFTWYAFETITKKSKESLEKRT